MLLCELDSNSRYFGVTGMEDYVTCICYGSRDCHSCVTCLPLPHAPSSLHGCNKPRPVPVSFTSPSCPLVNHSQLPCVCFLVKHVYKCSPVLCLLVLCSPVLCPLVWPLLFVHAYVQDNNVPRGFCLKHSLQSGRSPFCWHDRLCLMNYKFPISLF